MIEEHSYMHKQSLICNKIMAEGNKSEVILKPQQDINFQQNLSQFYKLHYPPRKSVDQTKNSISFRAKSVNYILPSTNPEQSAVELQVKLKKSLKEKIKQHERHKEKLISEKNSSQKFSFKQVLSKQSVAENIADYFTKFPEKTHIDLDDYSRKNMGMKLAIQRCKDEKVKIQKVISSNKQSEETKLDYLQLKKKDIEAEISNQIKAIYEEFFKKEYQQDKNGYNQFESKIKIVMEILQQQMFGSK